MPDPRTTDGQPETLDDLLFDLIDKAERLADAGRNITVATPGVMTQRAQEVADAINDWNGARSRALPAILRALKGGAP